MLFNINRISIVVYYACGSCETLNLENCEKIYEVLMVDDASEEDDASDEVEVVTMSTGGRRRPTARMSTGGRAPLGTKVASGSCGQQRYVTSDGLMKLVTQ